MSVETELIMLLHKDVLKPCLC